jgi:hypothetical protein
MPSFPVIIDTQFAENVSTKGNRCGVTFSPPLQIPANSSPRLRLYSSSIAYNFPNVSVELGNNTLVIDRYDDAILGHRHTVTFKDGLYGSLDDIAQVIKHSIHSDANFAELEINLIPVTATQRVHIEVVNGHTDTIHLSFTSANSIGPLIGFTADKYFTANTTETRESDTTAALDRTTSILVQTSMCSGSVVAGKGGQSTLAVIHLAAFSPASVVAFSPNNMLEVPAPNLAGASVTNATFALVNQNNEDLDTLNEQWQLVIEVVW